MRPFLLNVFFYRKLIADRSMEADVYAEHGTVFVP
ncbi:BnaC05g51550D [Brassica napus]|uniref:BnaC05g51530D protein n=1 Tax=Brassica napus TaxID=3708 RepID=A0A078IU04_BRANA|nr:BnaC05g51530D [Brassica napus]CDY54681.1 BnaC05g51550D [Brassica napus]